jgi:hypothetical protein
LLQRVEQRPGNPGVGRVVTFQCLGRGFALGKGALVQVTDEGAHLIACYDQGADDPQRHGGRGDEGQGREERQAAAPPNPVGSARL